MTLPAPACPTMLVASLAADDRPELLKSHTHTHPAFSPVLTRDSKVPWPSRNVEPAPAHATHAQPGHSEVRNGGAGLRLCPRSILALGQSACFPPPPPPFSLGRALGAPARLPPPPPLPPRNQPSKPWAGEKWEPDGLGETQGEGGLRKVGADRASGPRKAPLPRRLHSEWRDAWASRSFSGLWGDVPTRGSASYLCRKAPKERGPILMQ